MRPPRTGILAAALALALAGGAACAGQLDRTDLHVIRNGLTTIEHRGFTAAEIEEMDIQRAGKTIAEIDHVLADRDNRILAVVISYGEVLGLGTRQAVMPIDRLQPQPYGHAATDMSVEELQALPAWER